MAIVALSLGGCGGGGDGPVIGASDEFIEQADAICVDTASALAAARAQAGTAEGPSEAAALIDTELPIRLDGVSRLREAEPPSHQAQAWERFLVIQEDRIAAQQDALAAAQKEDDDTFQDAQAEFEHLSDQSDALASRLGLEACANRLPPAGENDVVEVVEDLLISPDSERVCRDLVTEHFVEAVYGGLEECEASRGLPAAAAIDLLDVGGVAATSAFVDVEVQDLTGRVRQLRADLVFDDESESWKVDYRQPLTEPR